MLYNYMQKLSRLILALIIVIIVVVSLTSSNTYQASAERILDNCLNTDGEYVITKKYNLHGRTLILPPSATLIFKGGSIDGGTIILSDNCKIFGNQTKLNAANINDGKIFSHQAVFIAENANNILIKDLCIVGAYSERNGNLNPWSDNTKDSQSLIFLKNCQGVHLYNVTISNFYNSRSNYCGSWNESYKSFHNMFPVNIFGCSDVMIKNCKELQSCGEAWNIMNCTNVLVDSFYSKQKYGTSLLSIIYCSNVKVRNCHLEVKNSLGNLLNMVANSYTIQNCTIIGGDIDFGNEHANIDIDLNNDGILGDNKEFIISNAKIINNRIVNGSITNNTVKNITVEYPIDNIEIASNSIELDISKLSSLRGINLGPYGGIRDCKILDNTILYKGYVNKYYALNDLYRYIPIVVYRNSYPVLSLKICNNTIKDKAKWPKDKVMAMKITKTLGASILVNISKGNVLITGNISQTLYDMNICNDDFVSVNQANNVFRPIK